VSELILYVGNRNYSSWSLRAWLALEQTGLPFRDVTIWLEQDADRRRRLGVGPTGRVPVLHHGERVIWDSLAIGEYAAELAPGAGLWPPSPAARAHARAICAEMHSGFTAVREQMPMNVRGRASSFEPTPRAAGEIERLAESWRAARETWGQRGPFLFGTRSLADAFYAPVASRLRTYGVQLDGPAAEWAEAILALPAMRDWCARAEGEGHPNPVYDACLDGGQSG
jgi:glutathione S-transferase